MLSNKKINWVIENEKKTVSFKQTPLFFCLYTHNNVLSMRTHHKPLVLPYFRSCWYKYAAAGTTLGQGVNKTSPPHHC